MKQFADKTSTTELKHFAERLPLHVNIHENVLLLENLDLFSFNQQVSSGLEMTLVSPRVKQGTGRIAVKTSQHHWEQGFHGLCR